MNVIQKLTLRHMLLNKRRTLVTVLGIVISVAMLTAVSTFTGSFMDLARRDTLARTGDWQVKYVNITREQADQLEKSPDNALAGCHYNVGYLALPDPGRESRPYLYWQNYDENGFSLLPMKLEDGRMPEKEGEVIVLSSFLQDNEQYKIGDTIRLPQGMRRGIQSGMPVEYADQSRLNPEEVFEKSGEALSFTIVGTFSQMGLNHNAAGYEIYGLLQPEQEPLTMQMKVRQVTAEIFQQAKDTGEKAGLDGQGQVYFNNALLRTMGVVNDGATMNTLYILIAIVVVIIMIGSVSLIYNAFAISLSERSRYLGMLSSVGATRQQKSASVFFEGAVLGAVAIPLGLLGGILGIGITFSCISPMMRESFGMEADLRVTIRWASMALAVALSALTIFISAYIPARKASRISAIEAIRQTGDIKLRQRTVRTSPLTRWIFGFPADLGLKNLKRNRGRYRATVFSLVISVVLFLTASSFSAYLQRAYSMTLSGVNYDVYVSAYGDTPEETQAQKQLFGQLAQDGLADDASMSQRAENVRIALTKEQLTEETLNRLPEGMEKETSFETGLYLMALDDKTMEAYLEKAGVQGDLGQGAVLVNTVQQRKGYQFEKYQAFHLEAGDQVSAEQITGYDSEGRMETGASQNITVAATTDVMPQGMPEYLEDPLAMVLVMKEDALESLMQALSPAGEPGYSVRTQMFFTSQDPDALAESLEEQIADSTQRGIFISNMAEQRQAGESLTIILQVFTYGFVVLLALISVANIFNTISTSIALRKREFAMLKSVGMTPQAFSQMMKYESLFYGLKALFYGLPLSFLVMVLLYRTVDRNFGFGFFVPWGSVVIAVAAVYLVVGITMLYGSRKVGKQNIIDGLRQENI
ncbi:ABC transporter permease [Intestinimonas butyriciproducens]|uniref:ABC transporter permease n=1 Tax=Intestinimonas butyriciproducens TaxID=1297617 RepID=UPI00195621D9|nr:ABC transporter permease [Intestinimonas butyriciproducens]MBM6918721.1 ABC transporter permease [Intestinimonas butyriciproducens]